MAYGLLMGLIEGAWADPGASIYGEPEPWCWPGDTAGWPSCQYSTEQPPTFRVYPRVCGGTER